MPLKLQNMLSSLHVENRDYCVRWTSLRILNGFFCFGMVVILVTIFLCVVLLGLIGVILMTLMALMILVTECSALVWALS